MSTLSGQTTIVVGASAHQNGAGPRHRPAPSPAGLLAGYVQAFTG